MIKSLAVSDHVYVVGIIQAKESRPEFSVSAKTHVHILSILSFAHQRNRCCLKILLQRGSLVCRWDPRHLNPSLSYIKKSVDTKPMVCKCYCCSSNLMLSQVSCICVFGAQFLVQCFQILLIPGLEQSSPRQSTALAIPGAKHTHNALLFMEIHTDLFCMHSELSTNTTPFPQATGRMWFEGHGCFI